MKEVFRHQELIRVHYFKTLLEAAEIPIFMRNENLSATEGVHITAFHPALCVLNEEDYNTAMKLIQDDILKSENASTEEIICESCGKPSPANFETCWSCEAELTTITNVT